MNQKGSAQLLIIVLVLAILAGGVGYIYLRPKNNPVINFPRLAPVDKLISEEYLSKTLGFKFNYPADLTVKQDTEEEFDKRGNGNFRKNFKGYVQYEPGRFLGGIVVLDETRSYDTNPFTLWVFDNPDDLTIDNWYKNYWYYPFVWGDFTSKGKIELAPKEESTISGQMAKSGIIDYQPGKPKFVYLSKDNKMYLFRIIGENGEKILSSLTFYNK